MSDDERPLTLQVMHAVAKSQLPSHLRHFVMTLALLAKSETGIGWHGQQTIATAMGCSDRQVRNCFRELAERPDSPVQIARRRRGAEGKGRSSDEWQLVLNFDGLNRKPTSASAPTAPPPSTGTTLPLETPSTGSPLPLQLTPSAGDQPEVCDSSTGSLRQLNRKPTSRERRSERRSERRPSAPSPERGEVQPVEGAHELKLHYVAEFEQHRGTKPEFGRRWSRAVKAFGELVTTHGLDTAKQIVTRALSDEFVRRINPWELVEDANKHMGKRLRPAFRAAVPKQVGVVDEAAARNWGQKGALELVGSGE